MKRRVLVASLSLALCLLLSSVALAGQATDTVKEKQTALFALLDVPKPDQKKIGEIFDQMLDYPALAQASLGKEWGNLTEPQQKEFTDLLKQLVQQSYERNLKKTVAFEIVYGEEQVLGDKAYLVTTKAKDKKNPKTDPIQIDFKLVDGGKGFKIVDIITEEVSLVDSYRSQFTKVIKKDGYAALVTKMKDKIAKAG